MFQIRCGCLLAVVKRRHFLESQPKCSPILQIKSLKQLPLQGQHVNHQKHSLVNSSRHCSSYLLYKNLHMKRLVMHPQSSQCRDNHIESRSTGQEKGQSVRPMQGQDVASRSHDNQNDHKYLDTHDNEIASTLSKDMQVYEDFINVDEERAIIDEIETHMKRLHYEFDHWDNAIQGYRELERKHWREENLPVLQRMKEAGFTDQSTLLPLIHVLDIAKEGFIKPHIDAKRFCGHTLCSLSLLSSCVMRLAQESDPDKYADVLLPRRSLYIMSNTARYDYTHEVLEDARSKFKGQHIPRDRRISVIIRNMPSGDDT